MKDNITIVFCLPGRSYSGTFLKRFAETIAKCIQNGISPIISQQYNPVVYYVRNQCLGCNNLLGKYQKPFNNTLKYDYQMWIDSDQVFSYEQIIALIKRDKDVIGGYYKCADNVHYPIVQNWDEKYFKKHGSFKFLTQASIDSKQGKLFKCVYNGFGFMLIKYGVIEKLTYPWFEPIFYDIGTAHDFASEDVSICKKIKDAGFDIWVDPKIRVGHEKVRTI